MSSRARQKPVAARLAGSIARARGGEYYKVPNEPSPENEHLEEDFEQAPLILLRPVILIVFPVIPVIIISIAGIGCYLI